MDPGWWMKNRGRRTRAPKHFVSGPRSLGPARPQKALDASHGPVGTESVIAYSDS